MKRRIHTSMHGHASMIPAAAHRTMFVTIVIAAPLAPQSGTLFNHDQALTNTVLGGRRGPGAREYGKATKLANKTKIRSSSRAKEICRFWAWLPETLQYFETKHVKCCYSLPIKTKGLGSGVLLWNGMIRSRCGKMRDFFAYYLHLCSR